MKVLHVGLKNYPPAHGGVEKAVFDLVRYTPSLKHLLLVEWKQEESENVKVLPSGLLKQVLYLINLIKKENVDIVHFNKETFIPHAIISSFFIKRVVITIHGCAWRIKRWNVYYRFAFYILNIISVLFVKKVVYVGKEDYMHFKKIHLLKKNVISYIPNGIEQNEFIAVNDNSKYVYIGRISPEKNILNMIRLFENSKNTLTIYGPFDKRDDNYRKSVLELIDNLSNVVYGGILAHDEIFSTLSNYNTFVNLSFSEGMPVSVLEAASVGLNLLLSNIPQHKDLCFPSAVYIEPISPIFNNRFRDNSISNKLYAEKNFSVYSTIKSYEELYFKLMEK